MAVTVKEGDEISLEFAKSGESKNGNGMWYKVEVRGSKGSDRIDVWADNAEEAVNFRSGRARVVHISSAKKSANQWQGKWLPTVSINAKLEEVIGYSNDSLMTVDDSELPFM